MPGDPQARTFDDRFTIAAWWRLAERAQKMRGKARLFKPFIKPFDLVFDIGAARGMMTLVLRWCGGNVIAVDPMYAVAPELVPEFEWKFGDDPYCASVPLAVSPEPEIEFWVHQGLPYLSSGNTEWMWGTIHQVFYSHSQLEKRIAKATTLDALIEEYGIPCFIKVDVEGDENNAVPTLTKPVVGMNMEFHQDWIPDVAIAHMDGLADYEWNYVLNNSGRFVLPEWKESEEVLAYMEQNLEERGPPSWGDIYCRQRCIAWPSA